MTLVRLEIEDFGLIERAAVAFADGLTVFTGETGSGKTMVLGALGFVLGERAETDLIRSGAPRARVVLELEPDAALRAWLAEAGFVLAPDDACIVVREMTPQGRSQARIAGTPASASQLRELGAQVVDVIGQHEAQRLLAPAFALDAVDRFGGPDVLAARERVRERHRQLAAQRAELRTLVGDDGRARAQLEFARFALAEIDAAALVAGEDERLAARRGVLANAERIAGALGTAIAALEVDGGAVDALGAAASALAGIARYGDRLAALASALGALQSDASECAAELAREAEAAGAEPDELEALEGRLAAIEGLKKKYGPTLEAIAQTREEFAAALARDAGRDARIAELETAVRAGEAALAADAASLGALRAAAAAALAARVQTEVAALAMPAARFSVAFETLASIGPGGAERAEFRLAPNPGEPERPLARSASGGELSRVLLAIVVALAGERDRTALVFDEIDAGIGGATAVAVGERLDRLAAGAQVILVTHLAQIAAYADAHVVLRKAARDGSTIVAVEPLTDAASRTAEIARMLSGATTGVSLDHAAAIIGSAQSAARA
jgi:DNA repair protein RecN (Recombination protein N)